MHHRLEPKQHRFHYNIFMFYIDLDKIDVLTKKLWMVSRNRFNFFSFKDDEHIQLPRENPDKSKNTKQHITAYLNQNGINEGLDKIMLLTNFNVLGYNFNPVSFYFCFDKNAEPLCAVAEIGNTFGEIKPFFLGKKQFDSTKFYLNTTKYFYVSPFIDHDTQFDFNLVIPDEKLNIRIDDFKNEKRFFISTLTGIRKPINNFNLLWYSIRFPFITLKIISLIHWHAVKLWFKKLPYHKKTANPELQKDVFRRKT